MIADALDTSYTDRDGANGVVYAYSVTAQDAAGNVSPGSNAVMAGKAKAKGKHGGTGGGNGKGRNK
jgi:cellulose 1,4-beta-cellobiosidase